MTVALLYCLYCTGYAEAWRISDGGVLRAFELSVNGRGFTDLERLILELALHDATDGAPMRSRRSFDRAIEQGAQLLESLGLHVDRDGAPAPRTVRGRPLLDEAA